MSKVRFYLFSQTKSLRFINEWDLVAFIVIFGVLFTFAWGASQMTTPYALGQPIAITLDPHALPLYSARTVLRMFAALILSLLFTFTFGTWAAKSKRAEQIIIPAIDVLQSVPVLSFLAITVVGFIRLFPGSQLGPECASIFAVFTAQAWNMALGFYQSLKSIPSDLQEAADMLHLSSWQRFWRIEVPCGMSSLLWNTMMSMSASWFFVVVSEAISVAHQDIRLPGIGSYIQLAIDTRDLTAVFYAITAMLVVILIYDQLLFRPLVAWSERYNFSEFRDTRPAQSWFLDLLGRTYLLRYLSSGFAIVTNYAITMPWFRRKPKAIKEQSAKLIKIRFDWFWYAAMIAGIIASLWLLLGFIISNLDLYEIWHAAVLGSITLLRIIILLIASSILWVPVGVWIGLRPRVTQVAQPIVQFLASFPANLLFPLVVMLIVRYQLNVEIWTSPLMILGSQWYILFNVIAGTSSIPKELAYAAHNLNVRGWLWWSKLILPAIFPYYVTGAITAAGGAWNASIVAEWVTWGDTTLQATGLGAYIRASTDSGDFPRIALGTAMMCVYVLVINRLLWRPLYRIATERYQLS